MLDVIAEPWNEPTLRRAMLELVLLSVSAGVIGCWTVLYNLSYSSESLSHAMLPGLVIATLTGIPLVVGGLIGVALAVVAIGLVARVPKLDGDTSIGIAVTTLLGAGVMLALARETPAELEHILFGDILSISDLDLVLAAALAAVSLPALGLLHRQLLAVGFDRSSASALGARVTLTDLALLALVAALILVAVQGLGNLLVVALAIGPAATARLVAGRVPSMMAVACCCSLLAGVAGLYVSYYADSAAGATIAAAIVVLYVFASLMPAARRA